MARTNTYFFENAHFKLGLLLTDEAFSEAIDTSDITRSVAPEIFQDNAAAVSYAKPKPDYFGWWKDFIGTPRDMVNEEGFFFNHPDHPHNKFIVHVGYLHGFVQNGALVDENKKPLTQSRREQVLEQFHAELATIPPETRKNIIMQTVF